MVAGKAQIDRFYFWDWSDWMIGVVGLLVITLLLNILAKKLKDIPFGENRITLKECGYHFFMPLILLYIGYILFAGFGRMFDIIIYLLPYIAIYLIHTIKIDKDYNSISSESNKYVKTITATIFLIIAAIIGYVIDDPVLSTASMVTLPFLLVLLFGKHIRHLERAKFYPIFIFAMFVVSREAWFLIPLLLLFFILRSYNYLRYQKVYPTFGVTDDQS